MKHLDEYRNAKLAKKLIDKINSEVKTPLNLMEVCGTHTMAISKSGIRGALDKKLTLLSGPGCPVCVTSGEDIDKAIYLASLPESILVTFGDMMNVPGTSSSLSQEKSKGADIYIVYSPLDALEIAENNPSKRVVFLGVGFETTAPTVALSIIEAKKNNLKNYFVFSAHKLIPPAMEALLALGEVKIDGFICPGHVSVIIGAQPYETIAQDFSIPCVVSGFEPLDILQSIYMLVHQKSDHRAEVEIQYTRGVSKKGNKKAQQIMSQVFDIADARWRGLGAIANSGLKLNPVWADFDAEQVFDIRMPSTREPKGCSCGEVLRGVKLPYQCKLFGKACIPENPIGPCMVSSEGACAAYFKYDLEGENQ